MDYMATQTFVTTHDQLDHASRLETVISILLGIVVTLGFVYYIFTDTSSAYMSESSTHTNLNNAMSDDDVAFVIQHPDGSIDAGYVQGK